MYAVIFTAEIAELDEEYHRVAQRMRDLATGKYGCSGVDSVTGDGREITVSWWESQADIEAWKSDPEHIQAQAQGKARWYRSYRVQVVQVMRSYRSSP